MIPTTRHQLFAAVAAALPLFASTLSAEAQVRVNQSGRAHDANTRVGSDGSNDRDNNIDRRGQTVTGNQIVTGNVTGGRAFRGNINYSDPLEFRGQIDRPSDRFVRDSGGVPAPHQRDVGFEPTAFYGADRATPPPPGFEQQGYTSGLYNTGVGQTTVGTVVRNPAFQTTTQVFGSTSSLLRPSGVVFGGRGAPGAAPSLFSASPLYGLRPLNEGPIAGVNDDTTGGEVLRRDPATRFRFDRGQIDSMQQELNEAGGANDAEDRDAPDGDAAEGVGQPSDGTNSARPQQPLNGPLGGRQGASLPGTAGPRNRLNPDRLAGSVETGQSLQRRVLVPPGQQSEQYRQLERRLAQRQGGRPLTDEEANRQFRLLNKAAQEDNAPAAAEGAEGAEGAPGAGRAPAGQPAGQLPVPPRGAGAARLEPGAPAPDAEPDEPRQPEPDAPAPDAPDAPVEAEPQVVAPAEGADDAAAEPLRIKSLAEGVEAKGLHDLLASAEELMKAGKFASAIEKYGAAREVAPNNPLIVLGRAHAELGATYYGRAEQSLREAIEADPALLMAQYDLEAFVGRDRLGFVVKDLKQIAATEAGAARPKLLLGYIAYSMPSNEAAAARYLAAAAERSKGPDPLIESMRKHWNLPAAPAAETPEADDAELDENK